MYDIKLKSLKKSSRSEANPFVDPPEKTLGDDKVIQIARDDPNTEVFSWGCDHKG